MFRERALSELRSYFSSSGEGIVAVYLFGSVARGQERAASDVDVGVVLAAGATATLENIDRLARIEDALARALGRSVDLVPMNGAAPDLLHRILVDGVLAFEADHEARIEFEVNARNAYFDIAPALERYRREVLRRA